MDTNTDRAYWEGKGRTKGYIINQLGLRGDRNPKALARTYKAELVEVKLEANKTSKKNIKYSPPNFLTIHYDYIDTR